MKTEFGDFDIVKVPAGLWPKSLQMRVNLRYVGGNRRVTLLVRRSDAGRWHRHKTFWDSLRRMTVLHELGHAAMFCPGLRPRWLERSHAFNELTASLVGFVRFGYLAPDVKLRHLAAKIALSWTYLTLEAGLSLLELTLLCNVAMACFYMVYDFQSLPWLFKTFGLMMSFFNGWSFSVAARRSRLICASRGLRSFRLGGFW